MGQLPGRPTLQREFPFRIVGVGRTPNLPPPQDLDPRRLHQPDRSRRARAVTDRARERPVPVALSPEVSLLDPLPALLGMASATPPHQLPEDPIVYCTEDALAHGISVVHGPALDLLIQAPDQVSRRHAARVVDRLLDLGQERLDAPLRWLDQDLAIAEAPDRLAQEIEAVLDMRDPGLLVGEFETPLAQEVFHERLDFSSQEDPRCAGDDEVIRIADQMDLASRTPTACVAEATLQQRLQPIQGPVRQRGGDDPPLGCA